MHLLSLGAMHDTRVAHRCTLVPQCLLLKVARELPLRERVRASDNSNNSNTNSSNSIYSKLEGSNAGE